MAGAEHLSPNNPEKTREEYSKSLQEYRKAWNENSLTPEVVNNFFKFFWNVKTKEAGMNRQFYVPTCDRTTEELAALKAENKMVLLLPDEAMSKEGLAKLKLVTANSPYEHESEKGGCVDVEMDARAPHMDIPRREIDDFLTSENRKGQRLSTYFVAREVGRALTGETFDERNWCVLSGTKEKSHSIVVTSDYKTEREGVYIHAYWLPTGGLKPNGPFGVGHRSEGYKQTEQK
jgi:hypothetical protein